MMTTSGYLWVASPDSPKRYVNRPMFSPILLFVERVLVSLGYVRLAVPLVSGPPGFNKGQDGIHFRLGKIIS